MNEQVNVLMTCSLKEESSAHHNIVICRKCIHIVGITFGSEWGKMCPSVNAVIYILDIYYYLYSTHFGNTLL